MVTKQETNCFLLYCREIPTKYCKIISKHIISYPWAYRIPIRISLKASIQKPFIHKIKSKPWTSEGAFINIAIPLHSLFSNRNFGYKCYFTQQRIKYFCFINIYFTHLPIFINIFAKKIELKREIQTHGKRPANHSNQYRRHRCQRALGRFQGSCRTAHALYNTIDHNALENK